ncbi:MAG: YqeG family HAD IIIA-type phosphatase [Lachnospiraceae bacterium]|nr:YqeG family HAD IIIA-type phosphatase [Lachnospiraceae bacterium]
MFQRFYPTDYVNSTYEIDFRQLYEDGYRGILFDIDNTLVEHGADASERAIALFKQLREIGFQVCLISNNNEERVKRFNEKINAEYIYKASKPSTKNYIKAMDKMGTNVKNTVFVGDQMFTDIYGANRAGIRTYLVKPIDKKEEIQIVFKRKLEKIVLYFYEKERKRKKHEKSS